MSAILPINVRSDVVTALRAHAVEIHARYAQYDGYFDTWVLGRVIASERFHTDTLPVGMLTLMSPHVHESAPEVGATRSTFNWRTGYILAMPAHKIVDA